MLWLMIPLGFGFVWVQNYLDNRPIEWVAYSPEVLDENLRDGRMVLLSFTARWHPGDDNAMPEYTALARKSVRRLIRSMGIVPIRADGTDESPEVRAALESLGEKHIPAVAIYPAGSRNNPIVLRGFLTEQQVLDALARAR
jgi:suppressor for copper-sensitivity B